MKQATRLVAMLNCAKPAGPEKAVPAEAYAYTSDFKALKKKAIDDCCFPLSKQGFTVENCTGYDASLLGAASLSLMR